MKDKCLNDFYKSLEKEIEDPEYVNSLKKLIKTGKLKENNLIELITKKVR